MDDFKHSREVSKYIELKCRENDKEWGKKLTIERIKFTGVICFLLIIILLETLWNSL